MIDQFKKAKLDKSVLHFKNFQEPKVFWEDILNFVFSEGLIKNEHLQKKVNNNLQKGIYPFTAVGNIQVQDKLWLAPQTSNLFSKIKGISELLYKVNGNKENQDCSRYSNGTCNCELVWHTQGVRISLADRYVTDHNDPHDILYWQILGDSFWKINNDITYELNPGDLLYFSQEDSHAVWCNGPRAGIIIDGIGLTTKH
jgi:hypothetical protein